MVRDDEGDISPGARFRNRGGSPRASLSKGNALRGLPNMMFIPLKTSTPLAPAREVLLYGVLLFLFLFNVAYQDFDRDYAARSGIETMCGWTNFNKISTTADYVAWWPELHNSLSLWQANNDGIEDPAKVVLVGRPRITRKSTAAFEGGAVMPFNATSGSCPWPLDGASSSCYTTTASDAAGDTVTVLQHTEAILNGSIPWSPANWISEDTRELTISFVLYMPQERRFTYVDITVSVTTAGGVSLKSASGETPTFKTYEPFELETKPVALGMETAFYMIIFWLSCMELVEIWACICIVELLLPFKILTNGMLLKLYGVQFYHSKTAEVYDPRDPATGEAFVYPDTDDLEKHMAEVIGSADHDLAAAEMELLQLKETMAGEAASTITKSRYSELQGEMVRQQQKLMKMAAHYKLEVMTAKKAAILQLSVMWRNNWSYDFEPGYLDELAPDIPDIPDNGLEAFKQIDWIAVARAYVRWEHLYHVTPTDPEKKKVLGEAAHIHLFQSENLFTYATEHRAAMRMHWDGS